MPRSARTAAGKPELAGMGATLVAAQVRGDEVRWISVGNSPFFLVSAGTLERLNADHSMAPQIDALVKRGMLTADEAEHHPGRHTLREAVMGEPLTPHRQGQPQARPRRQAAAVQRRRAVARAKRRSPPSAVKPVDGADRRRAGGRQGASGQHHGGQAGACTMSKSGRHRGDARSAGREPARGHRRGRASPTARWWRRGATSTRSILPRSANKPIQAMAFVESGAVERFGLGNEHIALACASHSGEKRHVETVRAWLAKVGLERGRPRMRHPCAAPAGHHRGAGARGQDADRRLQQLLGQAQRLPHHGGAVRRADARATSSTTIRCSAGCARS